MFRLLPALPLLLLLALPVRAEIPIREVTSPGGITAWLVEEHGIPFTALEIRFQGGTSLDPEGKRGAVNLMTALLEEGEGDLDSQGFAAARDALAAEFRFSSDADTVGVSARFLTENRDQAIDLLRGAIVAPRFDSDAVERVRGQILVAGHGQGDRLEVTQERRAAGVPAAGADGPGDPHGVAGGQLAQLDAGAQGGRQVAQQRAEVDGLR